jgi:hypothetical protein
MAPVTDAQIIAGMGHDGGTDGGTNSDGDMDDAREELRHCTSATGAKTLVPGLVRKAGHDARDRIREVQSDALDDLETATAKKNGTDAYVRGYEHGFRHRLERWIDDHDRRGYFERNKPEPDGSASGRRGGLLTALRGRR